MKLTKEQQIAHLLNRFGLGATAHEIDVYAKLGVKETKKRLIEWQTAPEDTAIPASRIFFYWDNKTVKSALGPDRVAMYWVLRMLTTGRPGRDKLALFWHSHFAVSGGKVEFGPAMMDYLDVLSEGNGKFLDLLTKVSKSAAMVQWLDTQTSLPGRPNENFAREVMELFTLGIGNYTEKDVQEAARCFSGWSYRVPFYELGSMEEVDRIRLFFQHGKSPCVFQDAPDMHDNGTKTVLGETGPLTAEDILARLAAHPKTAERLARKMWEFYAYSNPEADVVNRLASKFLKSGGDVKALLYGIADAPEFWSDKAIGSMVKSPVHFAIGALRQVRAGETMLKAYKPDAFDVPLPQPMLDTAWATWNLMSNQGLTLIYPPDVSGWQWGPVWATPAAAVERTRMPDIAFAGWRKDDNPCKPLLANILQSGTKDTPEQLVDRFLRLLCVEVPPEKRKVLADACRRNGDVKSLQKEDAASWMLHQVAKVVYAAPEYQLC